MTPTTGMSKRSRAMWSAAAVAVLQAITTSLVSIAVSIAMMSRRAHGPGSANESVGEVLQIGHIDERFARHLVTDLAEHGQAADTGVEPRRSGASRSFVFAG